MFSKAFIISAFALFVACSPKYGDVRDEFLVEAKKTKDFQKYRAARFLARSMENSYSLQGESLDLYCRQLDSFYQRKSTNVFTLREFNDSLFKSD